MDTKELLCVLADMYVGSQEGSTQPRWFGNGSGPGGLEQGIYNHMTSFRRVSDLWAKIMFLLEGDKELIKKETYSIRDYIVTRLADRGTEYRELFGVAEKPNE